MRSAFMAGGSLLFFTDRACGLDGGFYRIFQRDTSFLRGRRKDNRRGAEGAELRRVFMLPLPEGGD
jgi:hypothetical protein